MNLEPQQTDQTTETVKARVFERMRRDGVSPRSRMWYRCLGGSIWFLWALSVIFGAISVAVLQMAWSMRSKDIFEATHDSPLAFLLEVLPFIWVGVFLVMTALAWYYFKRTRRGYRYPALHIIGSSLFFSIIGGLGLQLAGVGLLIDKQLGENMPLYMSQEKMEYKLWQAPAAGRLVGGLLDKTERGDMVTFKDTAGTTWQLDTMELAPADLDTLYQGERVKVLGLTSSTTGLFYACGVFPWMFVDGVQFEGMDAQRRAFIERMYAHKDTADRLAALDKAVYANRETGVCARLPVIQRIEKSMR